MSKHIGITRMAKPGDTGILEGYGMYPNGMAMLNLRHTDGTASGVMMPWLWADAKFQEFKESEIRVISPSVFTGGKIYLDIEFLMSEKYVEPTAPPLEQFADPATGQPLFRQKRD